MCTGTRVPTFRLSWCWNCSDGLRVARASDMAGLEVLEAFENTITLLW